MADDEHATCAWKTGVVMTTPLIAVVEDDVEIHELLADVLTKAGYRTLFWDRGAGTYEASRQAQPQLIILDLWLEHRGMGSMVLGMLMVDPATQAIPIIVCTAFQQLLGDQVTQLRDRGYPVLEKPYRVETLLAHIQTLLAVTPPPRPRGAP